MTINTTGLILSQIAQTATEVAAIASAKLSGFGRKNDADQAAVDAMRRSFQTAPFSGKVVIGEGAVADLESQIAAEAAGGNETATERNDWQRNREDFRRAQ
ncbi:MAG: fructose-bisphosphatase class II, partial [Alphaproteobacteria bacterium]